MTRRTAPLPALTRDMTAKLLRDYSCAWCGVVTRVEVLEQVDGDRVCPACAEQEHREQERREGEYTGPVHEAEGWK
jgi:uncharacterized Zn finger protein (UPF0148 family)